MKVVRAEALKLGFAVSYVSITHDVPAGALAVARSRQEDKPGWAEKRRASRARKG